MAATDPPAGSPDRAGSASPKAASASPVARAPLSPTAARRLHLGSRWQNAARWPLVALGLAFVVGYSVYVLAEDLPPEAHAAILAILALAWICFLVDYVVRLALTPLGHKWMFVRHNVVDLLSVLLPVFRALRVLDLLRDIPYLQRRSGAAVRTRIIIVAAAYAVFYVYFLSLSTLQAERDAPGARIRDFGDAIWWACETLSTVGYGDMYPVTTAGRFSAVLLMIGGIIIVGVVSGTVVSYLSDRIRHAPEATNEDA